MCGTSCRRTTSRGLSLGWCGRAWISRRSCAALGQPPFDPRMMVSLLLHGYASGLYSSRRIARASSERNAFVMIVALDPPDFPNDRRLPQAPFEGARRVVPPGSEVVRDGRAGQTRPRRIGWHEDQSECVET